MKKQTIIIAGSVKVMLSYDYSHFEASMSLENADGITLKEMDEARKNCQRLADKAVSQYKKAKIKAAERTDGQYRIENFRNQCERIKSKSEGDRTINEIAMLKRYEQENWESQFDSRYDYEDEEEDLAF